MKMLRGVLHVLIAMFALQYGRPATAASTVINDHSDLDIHISLLQQVEEPSPHTDNQVVSVSCGSHQASFRKSFSHLHGLESDSDLFSNEFPDGQYYLELNGSDIGSYSTSLEDYTQVREYWNLTTTFHIPKLERFFGDFTCGFYNYSESVNITKDLAFAYVPTLQQEHSKVFVALFITFCTLFLLLVLAVVISTISSSRYKCAQKKSKPHFETNPIYEGPAGKVLPPSPILLHNSSTFSSAQLHRSLPPRAPEDSLHSPAIESAAQTSREIQLEEKGTIDKLTHSPVVEPAILKIERKVSSKEREEGGTIDKLISYLDHPSVCQKVNCPCFLYKQKVKKTKFWSAHMGGLVASLTSPVVEIEASPYHMTGCSIDHKIPPFLDNNKTGFSHKHIQKPSLQDAAARHNTKSDQMSSNNITYPQISPYIESESDQFDCNVKFIDPVETVMFDSNGGRYVNENHEVYLTVPKGAIPRGKTISIEVGVSLHSSLVPLLPSGKRPVSPLVQVCVVGEENFRFLKPVEITLPHYLDIKDEGAVKEMELQFIKSGHNLYCFHQCDDGIASFRPGGSTATLKTKHFCTFCLVAKENISNRNVNYRLVKVVPKDCNQTKKWRASFCVAFYLRTCLQALKKQFPDAKYELKTLKCFKFTESTPLEICFERKLAGGWYLSLENSAKILPEEVVYWNKDPDELEMMEEDSVYPPRFDVKVCGSQARETVSTLICFRGMADGGYTTELMLESSLPVASVMPIYPPLHVLHPSVSEPVNINHIGNHSPRLMPRRISSKPVHERALSDSPSHSDLMNFVAAALPTKWQLVGIQLGLSAAKLSEIEHRHFSDCERCFGSVFQEWEHQDTSPYTWETVIEVLRQPSVEENRVAEEILALFRANPDTISMCSTGSTVSSITSGYYTDEGTRV